MGVVDLTEVGGAYVDEKLLCSECAGDLSNCKESDLITQDDLEKDDEKA
jgi:hypothetical protein